MNLLIKSVSFLCLAISCVSNVIAQTVLEGKITDSKSAPLQGVTVMVLNPSDSIFISGEVTQDDGCFKIAELNKQEYLIEFSMIGFKKKYQSITLSEKTKVDIVMDENIEQLKEIVVLGNKNQIQVEAGKTVVNLGISPLGLQGNALDVLSKLPGVIIRDDGSVYLHGKSGVNVLINDKPTYLS
ncbi:MAG: carboxypeptidase-like regulatory domain-containing protein, partial [Bacteroidales bacterium]